MMDKYEWYLIIIVSIFGFITVVIPIAFVYFVAKAKQKMKENRIKLAKDLEEFYQQKWEEIYEMELRPSYEIAKNLFTEKKRVIKKDQLEQLKSLLYDSLGSFKENYKYYDFDGKPHKEIYVLMKNKYIEKSQWDSIIKFLKEA